MKCQNFYVNFIYQLVVLHNIHIILCYWQEVGRGEF